MERLSYIDEHARRIPATPERVWTALQDVVAGTLRANERSAFTKLLGAQPREGFAIAEQDGPQHLTLRGRHRFARYELSFELARAEDGAATQLRAQTCAEFPGPHGRVYRALVIGTRGHVVAVHHLLRQIERRAVSARA